MLHALLADARFWQLLHRLDEDLAATAGAARCPHCGGALHRGDYPRKPRGVGRARLGPAYERRHSFCCSRDGCRRVRILYNESVSRLRGDFLFLIKTGASDGRTMSARPMHPIALLGVRVLA